MRRPLLALLLLTAACGSDDSGRGSEEPPLRWDCPAGWVAYGQGGCGPAVLLCADGGGAADGACDGAPLGPPAEGEAPRLFLREDGSVGGAWPSPGSPGGPPAEDWEPDAAQESEVGWRDCPPGWMADGAGCDPALAACERGTGPLPGGGCTRTGASACPRGDWPEAPSGVEVVHVRAGADAGIADGTAGAPYASIADGLDAAADGGAVLVAEGRYEEELYVDRAVDVLGVCAERVVIAGPRDKLDVSALSGAELRLAGVTLLGGGFAAHYGARAELEGVRIVDGAGVGVVLNGDGTRVDVTDLYVVGTRTIGDGGDPGVALRVNGGRLTGRRVAAVDNPRAGVWATGSGSFARLEDVTLDRVPGLRDGRPGNGAQADDGASVELERALVRAFDGFGVLAGAGGNARLVDVAVQRGTRDVSSGVVAVDGSRIEATRLAVGEVPGLGVSANVSGAVVVVDEAVVHDGTNIGLHTSEGGRLEARRVLVRDIAVDGVHLEGGEMEVERSVVRDCGEAELDGAHGCAVVEDAGAARLAGSRFEGCRRSALVAIASTLAVEDSVVADAMPTAAAEGVTLAGIAVAGGVAVLDVRRTRLDGVVDAGILALNGARATIADSVIADVRADSESGIGLWSEEGSHITADRVLVANALHYGLFASGGAELVFRDGAVRHVRPALSNAGHALHAQQGAAVRLERSVLADAWEAGIVAAVDASVEVVDVAVVDVQPADYGWGTGVTLARGATLDVERLLVERVAEAGLVLLDEGTSIAGADVVVTDVRPTDRGYGFGASVAGGASLDLERAAITHVHGAAIAGLPFALGGEAPRPAAVVATDLFVRDVASSPIRYDLEAGEAQGRPVAYGLHAVDGSSLEARRVVLDEGGYGFYVADGALRLDQAVIARQLDAAGARRGGSAELGTLDSRGNAAEVREAAEGELPAATALPGPTAVCVDPPCD